MKPLIYRYLILSTLVMLLCVHIGMVTWSTIRLGKIESWSSGIQLFGSEKIPANGSSKGIANNLQKGTWLDLLMVRSLGGFFIERVKPGSPADRAGLRAGDKLVSINGVDLKSNPSSYFQAHLQNKPGDRLNLSWIRDDQIHTGILTLEPDRFIRGTSGSDQREIAISNELMSWLQRGPFLIFPLVLLCFGTWMGYHGMKNTVAFRCALLVLTIAMIPSPFFYLIAAWPDWMITLSLVVVLSAGFLYYVLILLILTAYPITTKTGSWIRRRMWFILTPLFVIGAFQTVSFLSLIYEWDHDWVGLVGSIVQLVPAPVLGMIVVVTAGCLLIAQRYVARRQQRMRLHFIETGFFSALILAPIWLFFQPGTLLASWGLMPNNSQMLLMSVWFLDRIVPAGLQCMLALAFAYAILAHRVFGLRFVLGKSIRYVITNQAVYLILSFAVFVILYDTIFSEAFVIEASDLVLASAVAGLMLILMGGWNWVKAPVLRIMDGYFLRNELLNRQRLLELGRTLSRCRDRDALLDKTCRELLEGLDLSCMAIYLNEDSGKSLSLSWHGVKEAPDQSTVPDRSYFVKSANIVECLLQTTAVGESIVEHGDFNSSGLSEAPGFELVILLGDESGYRGALALGAKRSEEPFTGEEKEQLLVLAAELELALENMEMGASLKQQANRMRELSRRLVDAQESERRRIARDLHDDTGQDLSALKVSLELTQNELAGVPKGTQERLRDAVTITDETLEKLRTIAHDLRPPTLDTFGLNASLDGLCKSFAQRTRISVVYHGTDCAGLSNTIDVCLYRILQEGLANCLKHGHATQVEVELKQTDQVIQLSILDNGQGFDPDRTTENQVDAGMGLIDMRERLEPFDGSLDIRSNPGAGTLVIASIPREEI